MLANPLSIAAKLGLPVPNLAPDVDFESHAPAPIQAPTIPLPGVEEQGPKEPKKKKYAKEAWPGKKPTHNLLVWIYTFNYCISFFQKSTLLCNVIVYKWMYEILKGYKKVHNVLKMYYHLYF